MPLNVLAVADQTSPLLYEYFSATRWANIDLVLSCGDLAPGYLDFLCTQLNVPVMYVRGNHDATYRAEGYDGCTNVHGKLVTYRGIRIAGFEGSRRYNGGPIQFTEADMARQVRKTQLRALRHGTPDIVLTHAPPAGCHDGEDTCHRGFDCFRSAIDQWQPRFFIHGHTHAYYRTEKETAIGTTQVINAFPYHVFQIPLPSDAVQPMQEVRPIVATGRTLSSVWQFARRSGTPH